MKPRSECCEACKTAVVPGALWPVASNGFTDRAYVERCDECAIFCSDDDAATTLAGALVRPEWEAYETDDGSCYITGFTFDEAECYSVGFAVGLQVIP